MGWPDDRPRALKQLCDGFETMNQSRWSLGIAAFTLAVQNGIVMAFGVLYLPMVEELQRSRGEVAGLQSLVLLLGGATGPLIGYFLDRVGPRWLFQSGALLAAVGLLLSSQAESLMALYFTYGMICGLGLAAFGSQPNMVVAALWHPQARGRAIAIADLGTGFGAFAFIPLTQALISSVGWRAVLVVWAVLLAGLVIPANHFQRMPPEGHGRNARGADGTASWFPAEAFRTPAFWWLSFLRFVTAIGFPLVNVHLIASAVGAGISAVGAATALGSVSLVSLLGRILTGWLSDRLGRAPTLTLTFLSAIAGIISLVLLGLTREPGWLVAFVAFYGLAQGSGGIVSAARAADCFAGPSFGTIYGWIVLATGPGEAFGAYLGGAIYDGLWGLA